VSLLQWVCCSKIS